MKSRTIVLAALAAFALAGSAHAATIVWSSSALTGENDVLSTGTVLAWAPAATSAMTVNTVEFTDNLSQIITLGLAFSTTNNGAVTSGQLAGQTVGGNAAYSSLIDGTRWAGDASGTTTITANLSGLILGNEYTVRVWVADLRGDQPQDRINTIDSVFVDNSTGGFMTGTFTADGLTQSFDILGTNPTGSTGAQINAMQVIPEPSAALLGGLGMLALLRRRR